MTQPQQPANTPISVVPNAADLPGARQESIPATVNPESRAPQGNTVTVPPQVPNAPVFKEPTPPPQQPPANQPQQQQSEAQPQQQPDTVEMTRFKAVQQIARQNEDDARAYRQLMESFGIKPEEKKDFDPKAEIIRLREDFDRERTERLRENIAHTTNVPVGQIQGKTQEEMQASAQAALQWVQGLLQQANVPAAVPASVVNSPAGPNDGGPQQIQTRDQLAGMSQAEIMAAYREGRLNHMIGKT